MTRETYYNGLQLGEERYNVRCPVALRILLRAIDTQANRYARYIEPLLSVSVDFYVRVFVRVKTGAREAKDSGM